MEMEAGKRIPTRFCVTVSHPSDHAIRISTVFMRRHGDSLGASVFLRDSGSGGTEWEVELRAINGGTWFDKGWKEFVRFHSIKEGYILGFKYKGDSRFLVTVFNKTGDEIVYSLINPVKVESDEDSTPVLVKKRGRDSDGSCEETPLVASKYSKLSGNVKLRACERDFKSKHPCFAIVLKTTYLFSPFVLHIPIRFWRSNFSRNKIRGQGLKFKVRLSNESTTWPVVVDKYNDGSGRGRIHGTGWRDFIMEKELTVGELCIIELLKKEKTFIVYRFK